MHTAAPPTANRRRRNLIIAAIATLMVLATYAITTTLTASAADTPALRVLATSATPPPPPPSPADPLTPQGKPALSSSDENAGSPASAAFDGNTTGTRWSSAFTDPQWIRVDLGQTATISQFKL